MNEGDNYLEQLYNDVWHILVHLYVHQFESARLALDATSREELAEDMIVLISLADPALLRIARLADKRRDVRSINNYIKRFGSELTEQSMGFAELFHAHAVEAVN